MVEGPHPSLPLGGGYLVGGQMRNGVPAWITEAWQAEDERRALALTPLGKVFGQLERGLITVREFADQVNRIVG